MALARVVTVGVMIDEIEVDRFLKNREPLGQPGPRFTVTTLVSGG